MSGERKAQQSWGNTLIYLKKIRSYDNLWTNQIGFLFFLSFWLLIQ